MSRHIGNGTVYQQKGCKTWTIKFYQDGVAIREATGTTSKLEAEKILRQRTGAVDQGSFVAGANGLTIADLVEAKFKADADEGLKDQVNPQSRWKNHLKPVFGHLKAAKLTTALMRNYRAQRKKEVVAKVQEIALSMKADEDTTEELIAIGEKKAGVTINRELAVMRGAYFLARKDGVIPYNAIPYFPLTVEKNTRTGFLKPEQYTALAAACLKEGLWLRTMFEIGVTYGWRAGHIKRMKVSRLDFIARTITVLPGEQKNDEVVTVLMTDRLFELLTALCTGKSAKDSIFTRDGVPVVDYRDAWDRARKAAGVPTLHFHDLRRTACKAFRKDGIDNTVGKAIMGVKTDSIYTRYGIVDETETDAAIVLRNEKQKLQDSEKGMISGMIGQKKAPEVSKEAKETIKIQ